jgi:hypothetical protein
MNVRLLAAERAEQYTREFADLLAAIPSKDRLQVERVLAKATVFSLNNGKAFGLRQEKVCFGGDWTSLPPVVVAEAERIATLLAQLFSEADPQDRLQVAKDFATAVQLSSRLLRGGTSGEFRCHRCHGKIGTQIP